MFRDRVDAAMQLARRLSELELESPVVLGIPRGGVVLAAALAQELGADLDVILARKLRAPLQPELAIGAVAEGGGVHVEPVAWRIPGSDDAYLQWETEKQLKEIERRQGAFRGGRPPLALEGRSVVVTDDGVATGATMRAALEAVRQKKPAELIVAIPVGAPESVDELRPHCDRMICLQTPPHFYAVGQFYGSFPQVDDSEVMRLLRQARPPSPPSTEEGVWR